MIKKTPNKSVCLYSYMDVIKGKSYGFQCDWV